MEAHPQAAPAGPRARREEQRNALATQWRHLTRYATFVALLTAPAFFVILYQRNGWSMLAAIVVSAAAVIAFRGLIDVIARKVIPSPSLYGADQRMAEEDVIAKRRLWYWRTKYRRLSYFLFFASLVIGVMFMVQTLSGDPISLSQAFKDLGGWIAALAPMLLVLGLQLPLLFFINLLILFGPLLFFGIQQIKGYEPGDADWGVKLEDVRGQAEAKQEVGRIISLWQSGEEFEASGGKRERGLLFLGAPGTGKTMLAKAIATNFNSPFVTIPGSGFAQTFIGMDVILVRFLIRKAKKLARKWGGQCIIFIDEIDAVGMRRNALGTGIGSMSGQSSNPSSLHDVAFYGQMGSFHPDGELLVETRAWRERLFAERAAAKRAQQLPPMFEGIRRIMFPGGMGMGGGMALNQLLVVMDGVDDPPWRKRFLTSRLNTFLDATYIVPQKLGGVSLRLPRPKPPTEQVFFVGATNVPIDVLDPALIRPGRMGRHIWFRTPTKDDRKDIFELYITKVAHEPDLDTPKRRDEMARITHGYSPAMIEQVCSMALTYAHSDGRMQFRWDDLVEAMTTVESGTAVGVEYLAEDTRAVAIHEAGHALASHIYMKELQSTRLSIRMRGSSLGHHQATEKDERFSHWRHRQFGQLVWILGAMAAEHSFYKENSTGVSGDVQSATATAALMAGVWAMGPEPVEFREKLGPSREGEERKRIAKNFETLGTQIMNRMSMGSMMAGDPIGAILADSEKRKTAAQLLGQAYVAAHNCIDQNRRQVEQIAEELIERKEMHGDEVVDLLERVGIQKPDIDYLDPKAWPKI
ncbi:MAG TPA: AAA family ATPase [Thermoleophilaceae bacterium]|nr:AAA family ATPase [Thermoleophilaceae bacterium]